MKEENGYEEKIDQYYAQLQSAGWYGCGMWPQRGDRGNDRRHDGGENGRSGIGEKRRVSHHRRGI
ncbi:MAG: hypothetical protein SOS50_00065 [Oliverpabstia sp.]|nr:hypothetical protein [Oliverpabstia sp.]